MMKRSLIIFLLVLFTACSKTPRDVLTERDWVQEDKRVILFVGDSLTAGYGLDIQLAYPALIEAYWKSENIPLQSRNAGISGDTTEGALNRLDPLLTSDVLLVFIAIGANDGLRAKDLASIQRNLTTMIERIRAKGIKVALAGIKIPISYQMGYAKSFQKIYPEVARQFDIPLMPFLLRGVAAKAELNLDDRLHPNALGHQVIAKNVLNFLNHRWKMP